MENKDSAGQKKNEVQVVIEPCSRGLICLGKDEGRARTYSTPEGGGLRLNNFLNKHRGRLILIVKTIPRRKP